jgi:hypothetical protein
MVVPGNLQKPSMSTCAVSNDDSPCTDAYKYRELTVFQYPSIWNSHATIIFFKENLPLHNITSKTKL